MRFTSSMWCRLRNVILASLLGKKTAGNGSFFPACSSVTTLTAMRATICDVGPRDGLQNEPETLSPKERATLVDRLAAAGLPRVEAASFVNPKLVPQMAGAEEVAAAIERRDGTVYAGLALNDRGYERLRETALDEVHYSFGVTDGFQRANANSSADEGAAGAERIVARAHEDGRRATVTLSVAFGCPYEGRVDAGRVATFAERVVVAGADEIVLADTIGVATPRQVRRLAERVAILGAPVGVHLHNTRNTGFANAYAALEAGITLFDSSVGGLGGCPYAPRATGNIATEDLVYLLEGEGFNTGVDLQALVEVAQWLEELLGRRLEGQLYRAGPFP
jgi:hydroxymethylglutaryl-CoA lyase/(R)-citramalyl-CoA lyase